MVNYSPQSIEGNTNGNTNGRSPTVQGNPPEPSKQAAAIEQFDRLDRLEDIVEQMAHAVLATTEVVERLGERMDFLSTQVQQQGQQFQQQGYQVYAITDAVQTLTENQADSAKQLNELMITISHLAKALEHQRR